MPSIKTKILSFAAKRYIDISRYEKHSGLPENFTITCHAGAMLTKANSLQSVEESVSWGADVVEFDVSFRPDSTPVIIHNSSPESNQGVLLEKALEIVAKSENCKINLDLKSTKNLPEVDRLVRKYGLFDRVFYTGVFADWVDTVKATSEIPYYLNHNFSKEEANKESATAVAEKIKALGACGLNSNLKFVTKEVVDVMHANGLPVSLWTAKTPKDMVKALKTCPDNITTKKPNTLKALIK